MWVLSSGAILIVIIAARVLRSRRRDDVVSETWLDQQARLDTKQGWEGPYWPLESEREEQQYQSVERRSLWQTFRQTR